MAGMTSVMLSLFKDWVWSGLVGQSRRIASYSWGTLLAAPVYMCTFWSSFGRSQFTTVKCGEILRCSRAPENFSAFYNSKLAPAKAAPKSAHPGAGWAGNDYCRKIANWRKKNESKFCSLNFWMHHSWAYLNAEPVPFSYNFCFPFLLLQRLRLDWYEHVFWRHQFSISLYSWCSCFRWWCWLLVKASCIQ